MGIVADEETTVEVAAESDIVGDIMMKAEEIDGGLIAVVQLDDGLTQVQCLFCSHLCVELLHSGAGGRTSDLLVQVVEQRTCWSRW